jgi:hypothetical protein
MTTVSRWINDTTESKWFVFASGIASIVSFYFDLRQEFKSLPINLSLAFSITAFGAAAIYSIRVREKLLAHQRSVRFIHDINHEYRNILSETFGTALQDSEPINSMLVTREREIIETVCHRIALIYSGLISRPCTVTVKIITKDDNESVFCHTYARSEPKSRRDRVLESFAVGNGENTAFDTALQAAANGISNFFSGDLLKMRGQNRYRNRRDNFVKYYKSAIVVPIRSQTNQQGGSNNRGFLCVDTLSTNCLNEGYHVELLAAFADQMYNFLSLMRGTYRLPSTPIQKE